MSNKRRPRARRRVEREIGQLFAEMTGCTCRAARTETRHDMPDGVLHLVVSHESDCAAVGTPRTAILLPQKGPTP